MLSSVPDVRQVVDDPDQKRSESIHSLHGGLAALRWLGPSSSANSAAVRFHVPLDKGRHATIDQQRQPPREGN